VVVVFFFFLLSFFLSFQVGFLYKPDGCFNFNSDKVYFCSDLSRFTLNSQRLQLCEHENVFGWILGSYSNFLCNSVSMRMCSVGFLVLIVTFSVTL